MPPRIFMVKWMPDSKEALNKEPRKFRAAHAGIHPVAGIPDSSGSEDIITFDDTGLGARHYLLKPGDELAGPPPANGRGQFWFVIDGSCTWLEKPAAKDGLCFLEPDDDAMNVIAGDRGAQLLLLQFAKASAELIGAGASWGE